MKLALALLALVALVHFGYDRIALGYADPSAAAKAWFYILRGIEGVALFAIVASSARHRAVAAICAVGMMEEGLTAVCRLSKPIDNVPAYIPFSGLCGQGVYDFGLFLLGVVALSFAYEIGRAKRRGPKGP